MKPAYLIPLLPLAIARSVKHRQSLPGGCDTPYWSPYGCYTDRDVGVDGILNFQLTSDPKTSGYYPGFNSSNLTPEMCMEGLRANGQRWGALYNGNECWGGTDIPTDSRQRGAAECNVPCPGDPSSNCGADRRGMVYRDESVPGNYDLGDPSYYEYMGCWSREGPNPVDFQTGDFDTFGCKYGCGSLMMPLMGRDWKRVCACGAKIHSGYRVDDRYCNQFCDGNTGAAGGDDSCGGYDPETNTEYWSYWINSQLLGCFPPVQPGARPAPVDEPSAVSSTIVIGSSTDLPDSSVPTDTSSDGVGSASFSGESSSMVDSSSSDGSWSYTAECLPPVTVTESVTATVTVMGGGARQIPMGGDFGGEL